MTAWLVPFECHLEQSWGYDWAVQNKNWAEVTYRVKCILQGCHKCISGWLKYLTQKIVPHSSAWQYTQPFAAQSKHMCVCVSEVIHSIGMLRHTRAVHSQRCPLCNLGQPWSSHYHINYIHVVAATVDWWHCYGFYTLDPRWKQSK